MFICLFKRIAVRLGEYDISTTDDGKHETIRVDHAVANKQFRRGVGINDIAIVFLVEDVEFTGKFRSVSLFLFVGCSATQKLFIQFFLSNLIDRIRPICLPTHGAFKNHEFAGKNPFLAGKFICDFDSLPKFELLSELPLA